MSGNEASAIASMRTIASAQTAYASTCGSGGFAGSMTALGTPPLDGGQAFIPAELTAATAPATAKSGYVFEITQEAGNAEVLTSGADVCNGEAPTNTTFFATAEPGAVGSSGTRFFATNQAGMIRQGTAALGTISDGVPLQ
jgi:hypothetical protein